MVAGLSLLICTPTARGTEPPGYDGPPAATTQGTSVVFAAYIPVADLVCACEFLDDGVTRKVGHGTQVVQTAAVSEVFFGDPSLKTIEVDKEYSRSGKGDKALLARLGPAQIVTIPDTPAARQGLRKAIHVAQMTHLESRFIDPDKLLHAGEELVRDYLAKLADRYPDHPWVGRNAVKAAKVVSCPAPLGSHIFIIGGLKPLETDRGRADIPRGDGLILWVAVGTNPQRVFTIGRPDKDIAHIEEVTRDHVENRHTAVRDGNGQMVQCWNGRLDSNTIRLPLAARPKPARYWPTLPPPDAPTSEWSAADEHGLQTRLIFMVRRAVQNSPMPLRVELRHKDGKGWAQNTIGGCFYRGSIAVTDGGGKELTQCCHDLRFNREIHGGGLRTCVNCFT